MWLAWVALAVVVVGVLAVGGPRWWRAHQKTQPEIDPNVPAPPRPVTAEYVTAFQERCMADPYMQQLYPNESARLSACDALWRLGRQK